MPTKVQISGHLLKNFYGLGMNVMVEIQQRTKQIRLRSSGRSKIKTEQINKKILDDGGWYDWSNTRYLDIQDDRETTLIG